MWLWTLHDLELVFKLVRGKVSALSLEIACGDSILTFLPGLLSAEVSVWFCPHFKEPSASALSPSAEAARGAVGEARPPLAWLTSV